MNSFEKLPFRRYTSFILQWLIAFLFMSLMLVTTVDVIGRYLFNTPLPGSTELTEFCLGLLIFSTLPIVCTHNQHISVDLLESWFSLSFRKWSDLVIQVTLFLGMGVFAYGMYILMQRALRDELVSEILLLPVSFFYFLTTFLILISMGGVAVYSINQFRKRKEKN